MINYITLIAFLIICNSIVSMEPLLKNNLIIGYIKDIQGRPELANAYKLYDKDEKFLADIFHHKETVLYGKTECWAEIEAPLSLVKELLSIGFENSDDIEIIVRTNLISFDV